MAYDYSFDYDPFDISKLRQQSIFGGMNGGGSTPTYPDQGPSYDPWQAPSPPPSPTQPPDSQSGIDLDMQRRINLMNQFFPEQTRASDRFNELVDNAPQMNNPGLGTRIGAGLASMGQYNKQTGMYSGGGPDVAAKIMYAPYLRDVMAWKDQITPAQQAATLENNSNNINRQSGTTMVNAEVAADRARITDANNNERNRIASEKNEIARAAAEAKAESDRRRDQILALKAERGDLKWDLSGPTVIVMGPDGRPRDTGVETGKLTEMQRLYLEGATKLAVTNTQNEGKVDVQQAKNEGQTNPASMNPNEVKQERVNRATEIISTNSALEPYIKINTNGTVTMTQPTAGFGRSIPKELLKAFDEARDYIFQDAMRAAPQQKAPGQVQLNPGNLGNVPQQPGMGMARDGWKYERDATTPNELRRTNAQGKVQFSHDGGKTWGVQ